ncbi:hypothetical protein appser6_19050 [Actinobacillus pleuropneumoniae serovar 6 str. Femo]|uniref:Uncharacterized protein n=1 Tax=Actinobacillus pleuropneumoniae serovar 6 str. Femo TaxID=754256 RepID=A0A828PWV8_ACTPL|nr:hypothetical protein appser6_19050 [Actinobacillus pleuropneumoniae serovar 6 str. Femo]
MIYKEKNRFLQSGFCVKLINGWSGCYYLTGGSGNNLISISFV